MSRYLREFNPEGNGQAERCNGVIWKAVTMSLKSKNLPLKNWQDVLPDVLHSVHSLLCTATNETPRERFFGFSRRSSAGASIPTWLATPGPVNIKRHCAQVRWTLWSMKCNYSRQTLTRHMCAILRVGR